MEAPVIFLRSIFLASAIYEGESSERESWRDLAGSEIPFAFVTSVDTTLLRPTSRPTASAISHELAIRVLREVI